MRSSSPARTPKLQLAAEQPSTRERWIPPKKDTLCPKAKEKPQQDGRRGKMAYKIKRQTSEMLRRLKQNLVFTRRPHRDGARHAFDCLSVSCEGMGQQWPATGAGALGAADLGVA